jgi:hypothetical protein
MSGLTPPAGTLRLVTPRQSRILLAASAWTLYVWISRVVILIGQDESAAFKAVHFVLAAVSIAFGLAVGWIGLSARRRVSPSDRRTGPPPPASPAAPSRAAPFQAGSSPAGPS